MNVLQAFQSPVFGEIRTIVREEAPWFVGRDVSQALGYRDAAKALRMHCKGVDEMSTPSAGGVQRTKIIPESDLYRLILRSKLPAAEAFQDWVTMEVLPTLRRQARYEMPGVPAGAAVQTTAGRGPEDRVWLTREQFGDVLDVLISRARPTVHVPLMGPSRMPTMAPPDVELVPDDAPRRRGRPRGPAKEEIRLEADIEDWVEQCCERLAFPGQDQGSLYYHYFAWCVDKARFPIGRERFGRALTRMGIQKSRTSKMRHRHLRVKAETEGGAA